MLSGVPTAYVKYLANGTASLEACGGLCAAFGNATVRCKSFTRFKPSGACLGHVDGSWLPMTVDGADSGQVGWPCLDALDCSLNGGCVGGACVCDAVSFVANQKFHIRDANPLT